MAAETELSEPAKLLLLASLLAKDGLISHNGELLATLLRHNSEGQIQSKPPASQQLRVDLERDGGEKGSEGGREEFLSPKTGRNGKNHGCEVVVVC